MRTESHERSFGSIRGVFEHRLPRWGFRWFLAIILFLSIVGIHFRGLWGQPFGEAIWGISVSADPVGVMSEAYEERIQKRNTCGDVVTLHSFPFGEQLAPTFQKMLAPQWHFVRFMYLFSDNPVWVYNCAILFVFALNFAAIFGVLSHFFRHWYVALIPASLVTFSAYTYAHSWAHLGLLSVFVFPLFFFCLSEFCIERKKLMGVWVALLAGYGLYSSAYYFYFLLWIGLVTLITHLSLHPRDYARAKTFASFVWLAFLLALIVSPFLHDAFLVDYRPYWAEGDFGRNYGQDLPMLNAFTARPRDYFLLNINHFLYGENLAQYITDQAPLRSKYSDELPVYLGVGPIIFWLLSVCTEVLTWLPRRVRMALESGILGPTLELFGKVTEKKRFIFLAAMLMTIIAFLLSMPPRLEIFGQDWRMPNDFIREWLPFRSYSRFGIVVLTGLALGMAMVIDETRRPALWTILVIAIGAFETTPKTKLHPASRDRPYVRFLRERPEKTMMRFESQNGQLSRALDIEVVLSEKFVLNGTVNDIYGFSEWLLEKKINWRFNAGHLRDMGTELLVVSGTLSVGGRDKPYLEKLAYFPEDNVEIWKILPSGEKEVAAVFGELLGIREKDRCFVTSKPLVEQIMRAYFEAVRK